MLASTGDGGGRNSRRRYIWTYLLGSSLNYILTFRFLAHEEDSLENIRPIFCLTIALKPQVTQ